VVLAVSDFLVPNATILVELVIFVALVVFLATVVLPPVRRASDERRRAVERGREEGEEGRALRQRAEAERERALADARAAGREAVEHASREADAARTVLLDEAERDASETVAAAARAAAEQAAAARAGLGSELPTLATLAASRVLGGGVEPRHHAGLLDAAVRGLGDDRRESDSAGAGAVTES
jgi:F-type H+-transporting ATPase subunit b